MSLIDALLLDPYSDPGDIWIALRSDGQLGSGTASDPYDGCTTQGPVIRLNLSFSELDVIFYALDHGYSDNDVVRISGVTGAAASYFINHDFLITTVGPHAFKITLTAAPPSQPYWNDYSIKSLRSGDAEKDAKSLRLFWPVLQATTPTNHGYVHFDAVNIAGAGGTGFNGSFVAVAVTARSFYCVIPTIPDSAAQSNATCSKIVHRFDEVMRKLPINTGTIVRIGPGTYETRGTSSIYEADPNNTPESVFVGFNIQMGGGAFVRPGIGIRLLGSGIGATTLKLVFAVDSQTQTSVIGNISTVAVVNFQASDFTIDCNLDGQPKPATSSFARVTVGGISVEGRFNRLSRIRVINAGPQGAPESFVLFLNGHYADPGGSVFNVVEDCIIERPGTNNIHETTLISSVGDSTAPSARSGIIRNCFTDCNFITTAYPEGYSNEHVAISRFVEAQPGFNSSANRYEFSFEAKRTHHLVAGNTVRINGVELRNKTMNEGLLPDGTHPYNSAFEVVEVSGLTVKCRFPGTTASFAMEFPTQFPDFNVGASYIGVDFHGPGALSGTGGVVEGNAVHDCTTCIYSDTGSGRDAVVRDNYFSNIYFGMFFNFNPGVGVADDPAPSSVETVRTASFGISLTHEGDGTIAALDTGQLHGLLIGDFVRVFGARINGDPVPFGISYNDYVAVLEVTPTKFKYRMNSNPGVDADAASALNLVRFLRRFQIHQYVFERNVCDLYALDNRSAKPNGLSTYAFQYRQLYSFPNAVLRENTIGHIDGQSGATVPVVGLPGFTGSLAFRGSSMEATMVDYNVLNVSDPHPINYVQCRAMKGIANITSTGKRLAVVEDLEGGGGPFQEQVSTENKIEAALLLSLL